MRSLPADRLVFDLDDTLYLERDFAFSGFRAVGDWIERRHLVSGFAVLCRELFDSAYRPRVFDEALRRSGLSGAQPVPELVDLYRNHSPEIALCPDAARYLGGKEAAFALITDGPERMQRNKIAALGLSRCFDQIIPTGQWGKGFGKPHPRAFEQVAAAADGRRCVYVADNAGKDFVTPNRMGWRTIQILRPERVHVAEPPDRDHAAQRVIETLDQLDAALSVD